MEDEVESCRGITLIILKYLHGQQRGATFYQIMEHLNECDMYPNSTSLRVLLHNQGTKGKVNSEKVTCTCCYKSQRSYSITVQGRLHVLIRNP